ncbi:MAG: RDD family protein [Cocleimonas sp.]
MRSEQTQQTPDAPKNAEPARLRSRFLAMTYDFLIILFITTVLVVIIELALVGDQVIQPDSILNKFLKIFWFIPGYFYLGHYWTKTGQTPSMRIWKIKLVNKDGLTISWFQALIRYVSALLGLGLFWMIFNKGRYALQDVLSNTYLIKVLDKNTDKTNP